MRVKRKEPLSNLEKRMVRVVEKGTPVTPATSVPEATRTASPTTSVEETTPRSKKQRVADKGKKKADSCSSNIWDDAGLALTKAQDAFIAEDQEVLGYKTLRCKGRSNFLQRELRHLITFHMFSMCIHTMTASKISLIYV